MKKMLLAGTFILCLLSLLSACNNSTPEETIDKAVAAYQQSAKQTGMPSKGKADTLLQAYQAFVDKNPDDTKTPEYLFKMGEIYQFHQQYDKGIATYQTIIDKYPNYEKTPQAMFLMAFAYENYVKDINKAKTAYESFLQKYPTHQLAKDAQFSLDNLGKTPEEVMDMILKKNKDATADSTAAKAKGKSK